MNEEEMKNDAKTFDFGVQIGKDLAEKEIEDVKQKDYGGYWRGVKDTKKDVLELIDRKWDELVFDLHIRACDLGEQDTNKHCDKFKKQIKKQLKKELGK